MATTITTRAAKGSKLTHSELDANFSNLKQGVDDLWAIVGEAAGDGNNLVDKLREVLPLVDQFLESDDLKDLLTGKVDQEIASGSGTVLLFDKDRRYGSDATPLTGELTFNLAGAKDGTTVIAIHKDSSAPTMTGFRKTSGSESYSVNVNNYIHLQLINGQVHWALYTLI